MRMLRGPSESRCRGDRPDQQPRRRDNEVRCAAFQRREIEVDIDKVRHDDHGNSPAVHAGQIEHIGPDAVGKRRSRENQS